jgi:Mce-associated membrane protein
MTNAPECGDKNPGDASGLTTAFKRRRSKLDVPQADAEDASNEPNETISGGSCAAEAREPATGPSPEGANAQAACQPAVASRVAKWKRVAIYAVFPTLAMVLALGTGYLKYLGGSAQGAQRARVESVRNATEATIAMLSYRPEDVEKNLTAAQERMTGGFRDSYARLTHDVVIPGAKQKQISATATVRAAASVSADPKHAVVLVFVNQSITLGNDAPTDTASSVRVSLDNINGRWLISGFDPV